MGADTDSGNCNTNTELEKFAESQEARFKEFFDFLSEERIVTNKDVALEWILDIGVNYDGKRTPEELMQLIDELLAYAKIALEKPE